MYAQQLASTLWRKSGTPVRLAFFASLATGLLAYMFRLTNTFFTTGDALHNIWFNGNLIWIGRWSSSWLSSLSTDLTMPYINGMLVIFAVAILSALVVALLDIRSSLLAILTGGVLMCFPTVSATLGYLHNADAYMLAAMLSVLGFFVLERVRWGMIPAVVLITIGTGTYQACAALVIGLMFVRGVQLIVETSENAKALWLRAAKWILCIGLSLILYYLFAQLFSKQAGIAIGDYQSVTEAASAETLLLIPKHFIMCYQDISQQMEWVASTSQNTLLSWMNLIVAAAATILTFINFFISQKKPGLRLVALVFLMLLAPFFLCSIRIFNPDKVYSLMTYSAAGIYLLAILMADRLPKTCPKEKKVHLAACLMNWLTVLCTTVCVFQWTVTANASFYNAALDYEKMYSQCIKFMDIAENNEDYFGGMPILVVGDMAYNDMRSAPALNETKSYYAFMADILGATMPFGVANDIRDRARAIADTPEFVTMSCYPAEDCVQVIEDCLVIKLGEEVH